MNGSGDFESGLHHRLVALAEPAPEMTPDVLTAVRRGARRRRLRLQVTAAAVALLVAVGAGAALRPALLDANPTPPGTSAAARQLLAWPTRTSGGGTLDPGSIAGAWAGGHSAIHVLYAGPLPDDTPIAVIEGRSGTGEARVAVLTRNDGTWQVLLDAPGFDTPPRYLFVALDAAGPSTVIALSAPGGSAARINDTGGKAVAILPASSAQRFSVPRETAEKLRLYVSASDSDIEEWSLRRWAVQGRTGAQVRLMVPDVRLR